MQLHLAATTGCETSAMQLATRHVVISAPSTHPPLQRAADAEQSRLLGLVSAQAAALADKERQLEVRPRDAGRCLSYT
jgi:hypothetical protein